MKNKTQLDNQLKKHDHYPDSFFIKKIDGEIFKISGIENGEGDEVIKFFAHGRQWAPTDISLNFTKNGINQGLIGANTLVNSNYYLLWAIFNETATGFTGFGLTKHPTEQATAISETKKGFSSIITIPRSYNFTVNSSVSIFTSNSDWNTGVIIDRDSTTITILLGDEMWGTNLTGTTPIITQYNRYKPYNINTGIIVSDQYKLLSSKSLYINSDGDLQIVYDPNIGFLTTGWWDKNFTSPVQILHPDYMILDGGIVINPLSPIVGETLRDLVSDSRFIRGSATSGTTQSDAIQIHRHSHANFIPRASGGAFFGPGTYTTDGYVGNPTQSPGYSTPRVADETRPINISMVPVVRILQ